jgi:acylphosphatase
MVQGVFFRAFTRDVASRIGLKGWVKNLPDGRVEAIFEGEREDIEQARIHCLSGPPGSRVDAIDVQWEEYQGDMKDFQVRHY